jgi:hypothetical protein
MTHDPLCPNASGSCCPWIGECACQCECEFAAKVRADERQTCVSIVQTVGANHQNNAGRNTWRNEALVKLGFTGHI